MANTSDTQISYITETTWGTTPATPGFTRLRVTGETLNPELNTIQSNELNPNRNNTDSISLGQEVNGNLEFELSYKTFDEILESAFQSAWSSNNLKNGKTQKSFTIEKVYDGLGATGTVDAYHTIRGAIVNEFTLNMAVDQIITGTASFIGRDFSATTAAITGATYTAANTNPVMSSAADFSSLSIEGVTAPAPQLINLSVSINNNLRGQKALGAVGNVGIGSGQFIVTGEFEAYFADTKLYETYLNNEAVQLQFTIGGDGSSVSEGQYTFNIPKIKLTAGATNATANNEDLTANMSYIGILDSTLAATMEITRKES